MGFELSIVNIGLLIAVAGLGIVVYIIVKFRDLDISEDPGELQFSNLKNIPGEDYVDLNVVKVGKTRTLKSYNSSGFISWEAFFNPKTREDLDKRKPATMALVIVYAVFTVMGGMMKLMDIQIGVYFTGILLVLVSLLVIIKYVQFGLRN
jgi:hypothetical protein